MVKFPFNLKNSLEKHSGFFLGTQAFPFETEDGKLYVGYIGYNKNKNIFFRINLPFHRAYNVVSHIDFFNNLFINKPNYSIIPTESTISNIIEILTKDEKQLLSITPTLKESIATARREQLFKYWVENNSKAKDFEFLTTNTVEKVYTKIFLSDKDNSEVPLSWFRIKYKEYLISMGIHLKRGRKTAGKRERYIEDPSRRAELFARRESFDFNKNLEVLKKYVQSVIDGKVKALLVYGPPGVGKSYVVSQMLIDNNLIERKDYVAYHGGLNDSRSVAEALFNHGGARDGKPKIILIDDYTIPKEEICVNMFAQAMDNNPLKSKYITYGDKKLLSDWEKIRTKLDVERNEWIDSFTKVKKRKPTKQEIKDFENKQYSKSTIKNKMPPSFPFEGQIIMVTNNLNVDPKILSRTLKILIDPTNKEVLTMMKQDDFTYENLTEENKKKILDVLEYVSTGVLTLDLRDFAAAASIYIALEGENGWEDKVIDNILLREGKSNEY